MLRLLLRNNIAQAEGRYQREQRPRRSRWRRVAETWLFRLAFGLSMLLFCAEFFGVLLGRDASFISESLRLGNVFPAAFTAVWHFALMLQTLILSANSIVREKQSGTWELLILTSVDARRIVWGKWWATVQRQWRHYLLLGVMRGALIAWTGAYFSREFIKTYASFDPLFNFSSFAIPYASSFLVTVLITVLLTLVNLLYTAACGVSASIVSRSSTVALVRAILTRILLLGAALLAWGIVPITISVLSTRSGNGGVFYGLPNWWWTFYNSVAVTLFDNGYSAGSRVPQYYDLNWAIGSTSAASAAAVVVVFCFLLILTRLLLWGATRSAVRLGVLPHQASRSNSK